MAAQIPVLVAIWSMLRMVFASWVPKLLTFFWAYRWFVLSTTLLMGVPIVDGLALLDDFLTWLTNEMDNFFEAIRPGIKTDLGGGYGTVAAGAALMNCVIALDVYGQMGVIILGGFMGYAVFRFGKMMVSVLIQLLQGMGAVLKTRR